MEYPSFPMPVSYGNFPHHSDMAAYLRSYAEAFSLRELIRFRASVKRLKREPDGTWCVSLEDGSARGYTDVVIAVGHGWCPKASTSPATSPASRSTRTSTGCPSPSRD